MKAIAVDVTPLAINRTAMHYITRDTLRWMVSRFDKVIPYSMNIEIPLDDLIANDFFIPLHTETEIRARLSRTLGSGDTAKYKRTFATTLPTFVLDPLYLLLAPRVARTLALVLDLTPLTHPEWHHPKTCELYRSAFQLLWSSTVEIAAISDSTARDLWANLGIPPNRVGVVPLYSRFNKAESRLNLPGGPLLYVGSLEERKNVAGLVRAYVLSGLTNQGVELHLAGGDGYGHEMIRMVVSAAPGVVIRGRLSEAELNQAYRECRAFVLPSHWEGFGLPALEALAQGIPILISENSGLPEIGSDLGILVDPSDVGSIAKGLIDVSEMAEQLAADAERYTLWRAKAQARIAHYSFERFTSSLTVLLDRLTDSSKTNQSNLPPLPANQIASHRKPRGIKRSVFSVQFLLSLRRLYRPAGDVPTDSYSAQYLFCLQESKRLALARAIGELRRSSAKRLPAHLLVVIAHYLSLLLTSVFVRAGINEILLKKIIATEDKGGHDQDGDRQARSSG